MKLSEYMKLNDISVQDFAKAVNVTRQAVYNWIVKPTEKNFCIPKIETMAEIAKFTSNEVKPRDFLDDLEIAVYNTIDEDIRPFFNDPNI